MSAILPVSVTGVAGAEEEARSVIGTFIAQIITFIRNIVSYFMEYMRKLLVWAGEHPEASLMFLTNLIIWIS